MTIEELKREMTVIIEGVDIKFWTDLRTPTKESHEHIDEAYKAGLQAALDAVGEDLEYDKDDWIYSEDFVLGMNQTKAEIRENIKKMMQ